MSSVPPAANIGNAFSPPKSFAACDDQSFPREEERVWTPRSLNQQQDGAAASSQSVIPRERRSTLCSVECGATVWSVERCRAATWSLALVPSGIGSGATDGGGQTCSCPGAVDALLLKASVCDPPTLDDMTG